MIKNVTISDLDWIVEMSHKKRKFYEKYQPLFWKMADNSNQIQKEYFLDELKKSIFLCDNKKLGFIKADIINPPEVYDA